MGDSAAASRMIALGERHARLESRRELDGLIDTLVAEPVYEFHTIGRRLVGGARVRRYYMQFFDGYMSRIVGGRRIGRWASEGAFVLENSIEVRGEHGAEEHRVISVLFAADAAAPDPRLGGERIYASEHVIRMMAGELFEALEPIA